MSVDRSDVNERRKTTSFHNISIQYVRQAGGTKSGGKTMKDEAEFRRERWPSKNEWCKERSAKVQRGGAEGNKEGRSEKE